MSLFSFLVHVKVIFFVYAFSLILQHYLEHSMIVDLSMMEWVWLL